MLRGEHEIGRITSSAKGHSVGQMLAMSYLDTAHSWPGHTVGVATSARLVVARVATTPFFDPHNARLRARPRDDARDDAPIDVPALEPPISRPPTEAKR